jgi:putative endopeptidase
MIIKLKEITAVAAVCFTAATLSTFTASAQHDSPKSVAGKFIVKKNFDETVAPGDNFFEYANGNWVKDNPIPAKATRWGSFGILAENNTKQVLTILNDPTVNKPGQPKGSIKQRVGDLYASAMDSIAIDKRGYNPIKPDLQRISQINSLDGVIGETIYDRLNSVSGPMFSIGVGQDSRHPSQNIIQMGQGGTSLPDRDYYLKSDARTKTIQDAYHKYVVTLFTLTGTPAAEAEANANTVFGIEKQLAAAQWSRVDQRDPNKTYNKFSIADFSKKTPHLNWVDITAKLKMGGQDSLLVGQPPYFKALDSLLGAVPVKDWKTYLAWNALKGSAGQLSAPFVKAGFEFNKVLTGQQVQAPRNERMANLVDGSVGELLGQIYVQRFFPPEAKVYMAKLVNNLKVVLGDRIKRLDWMGAETKVRALKKLDAFTVKIAYPDKWQNYDGLVINRDDYFGNLKRVSQWRYNYNVSQLGKPIDKTRWGMTPPTVNAYYNPVNNEIVFPAGILQFPFFDFNADDALNYGGIGAVIGHEMTHGFDDQGRQYDYDGTLRDWWTKDDADKFKARANKVVEQYNAYTVVDTATHVNGKLTLGENLADLGGLSIAYEAFKKTKEGQSNEKIDGFTPDQRFFLSWAQVWRSSQRDEAARQRILTDPHSPELFRTNAPLTNMDAWYKAFDIKPTNKLYKKPEDRIKIW